MDTKAAFDREAFAKEHGMTMEFVNWFFDKKADGCGNVWYMMAAAMWEGWKESRAEIEIELNGAYLDADKGKIVLSYTSTIKEIASHGIRIKGKTV